MRLYRHYKNKFYTYIGEAKHSETLEDMVLYETRYKNPLGQVWVRPKTMFFEEIQHHGNLIPRFESLPLEIESTMQISKDHLSKIATIFEKTIGEWDMNRFESTLQKHPKCFLLMGFIDHQAVAFKLGYEVTSEHFYSWIGGVLPEFRGLGIANELMKTQHQWCIHQGYKKISTKSQNRFKEMLILNLKNGFDIVDTDADDPDGVKVLLEKTF